MSRSIHSKLLRVLFAVLFALSIGTLVGCEEQGPAEEAGEEIDEAVEEAGDEMEEAADEVDEEVDEATDGGG